MKKKSFVKVEIWVFRKEECVLRCCSHFDSMEKVGYDMGY